MRIIDHSPLKRRAFLLGALALAGGWSVWRAYPFAHPRGSVEANTMRPNTMRPDAAQFDSAQVDTAQFDPAQFDPANLYAQPEADLQREVQTLMGTWLQVEARHPFPEVRAQALSTAFAEAKRLEQILTCKNASAPLGHLHASGRLTDAPKELVTVLRAALNMAARSATPLGGGFNPAVAPLLNALHAHAVASQTALPAKLRADLQRLCAPTAVSLQNNSIQLASREMRLTLDGIAKGFIVDAAAQILEAHGVQNYLVNAGGDLRVRGEQAPGSPWLIGIQSVQADKRVRSVALTNGALATSGNGERTAHGLGPHIVPGDALASTSVWAPTAMEADALSTALFALPYTSGQAVLAGRQALWQMQDGSLRQKGSYFGA